MDNKRNYFNYVVFILFCLFVMSYVSSTKNYYLYKTYQKNNITHENIIKFESDIQEGKDVTLNDYIEEEKDYTNNFNRLGTSVGIFVESMMKDGIKKSLEVFLRLFFN